MEQIIMNRPNGTTYPLASKRTATKISSAKQTMQLLGDDVVNITIESPFPQTYGIGDYTTIFGRVYKINQLPTCKKNGMHEFSYDITLEGIQYDLLRIIYELNIDTTTNTLQDVQGDALTGDLRMFATVLLANSNRVFPGKWALGACHDTETKTLTFSEKDNCLSVMQSLCQENNFNCEYEIEQINGVNIVNFVEKVGQVFPYTFEFGRGKGLYSLDRQNVSSSSIVTRLFVFGSSSNITSKYRAKRLCLPGKSKAQSYIEDANAIANYGVIEGKKYFDDIKPTFKGSITNLVSSTVLEFEDTKMFDLNTLEADGKTTKYLIDGVTAKIHFNTGNLAGYEFEIAKYDHSTHKITLKKQTDDRGDVFPSASSAAFQFAKGDEYKILDVALPESYQQDAEAELQEKGTIFYNQNSQPKVKYGLNITKAFLEKTFGSNGTTVNIFIPGDYIPVKDADIDVDKSVRIQSFVRDLLDEYNYTMTISDTVTTNITNRVISDLIDIDKIIQINDLKDPARAKANWRSSREVLDMVFDPDGDYYTDKIKPNSIDTMALSVGAKSMQFGLQNTILQPNYNSNPNVIKVTGGVLTHYTIEDDIRAWVLTNSTVTLTNKGAYYIYARCSKTAITGSIVFNQSAIKVDEDANNYHFLIGTLNAIDADLNYRTIYMQYGFTMINGRFIRTGRIESADGTTYFDLDDSEIGGRIVFTSNGEKKTLEDLGNEALESKNYINNTLPGLLDDLTNQIDGKIDTWYQSTDPSEEWTTNPVKIQHVGDMWYNTSSNELKRYSSSYAWELITDAKAIDAYTAASKAQDTADGKRRVFVAQPYPPYDVGDLWVNATYGTYSQDLLRCNKSVDEGGKFDITNWSKAANYTDNSELHDFIQDTYNKTIAEIQSQIDGQIEQFFDEYDPTLSNEPACGWTTKELKDNHLGDLFYNTENGKVFRWVTKNSEYQWIQLQDEELAEALVLAQNALDLAGSKRRIFGATPIPPYDVDDLWVQGETGDIMRCIKSRMTPPCVLEDWVKASKYTDDSALNDFIDGSFIKTINSLTNQIDGKIETWFTSTDPATSWTTDDIKKKHVDDVWYNITAGTLWYYHKDYTWKQITDQTAIDAYTAASKAQDTADGKRRVFTATPTTPYDVGDLWAEGENGDIYYCKIAKSAQQTYSRNDWAKASKYTDDSALNDFIDETYKTAIDDLTNQIDGKIETWFTSTDPATSWTTDDIKKKHVGDMWFNQSANKLKRYSVVDYSYNVGVNDPIAPNTDGNTSTNASSATTAATTTTSQATSYIISGTNESPIKTLYAWVDITDQTAIDAYTAASKAQDTADGKRRVFITIPFPPYDVGDLWVDGTNLRRCAIAKASGAIYNAYDWITCVAYDNTQTVIDGGLVTSGTIQVAGDSSTILAGMTGQGTAASAIRFWAGASFENRATAPYRVTQDGSVVMTKAKVEGEITATSGTIGGFEIGPGRIGVEESIESGLSLSNESIRFHRTDNNRIKHAAIGNLTVTGFDNIADFRLTSSEKYMSGIAIYAKCRAGDGTLDYMITQRALEVSGNVFGSGKMCFYNEGYIGEAYQNVIIEHFNVTQKYHITSNSNEDVKIYLPTKEMIENIVGNNIFFDVEIVCDRDRNAIKRLKIASSDNAQIYDNNGNTIGEIPMAHGDALILRYYNGGYTRVLYAT